MSLGRLSVPSSARRGEVLEVRVLIQHPMETGFRFDVMGRPIPKNVVNTVVCRYNGTEVFRAELGSGVAANPYLQFHARAEASGAFEVEWVDDKGERGSEKAAITVA
jgi:sulfur-oxidizing protein SoxZ